VSNINWDGMQDVAAVFFIPAAVLLAYGTVRGRVRARREAREQETPEIRAAREAAKRRHPAGRERLTRHERAEWRRLSGGLERELQARRGGRAEAGR
jgi:hypothetical protein